MFKVFSTSFLQKCVIFTDVPNYDVFTDVLSSVAQVVTESSDKKTGANFWALIKEICSASFFNLIKKRFLEQDNEVMIWTFSKVLLHGRPRLSKC